MGDDQKANAPEVENTNRLEGLNIQYKSPLLQMIQRASRMTRHDRRRIKALGKKKNKK